MTKEDVDRIKQQVAFANTITDERQRHEAFELIAQQRDEILLDCFSKQSDRIKSVVAQNIEFQHEITEIQQSLNRIETSLCPLQKCYQRQQNAKQQKVGMIKLLEVLKYIGIFGGSTAVSGGIIKLLEIL